MQCHLSIFHLILNLEQHCSTHQRMIAENKHGCHHWKLIKIWNIVFDKKSECWFVCLFFLTTSSTTTLFCGRAPRQSVWQFYVLSHMRQSWETMTSVSVGHIILTPTQPVWSGRPQRESNPGPPHQESRALPTELPRPPLNAEGNLIKKIHEKLVAVIISCARYKSTCGAVIFKSSSLKNKAIVIYLLFWDQLCR